MSGCRRNRLQYGGPSKIGVHDITGVIVPPVDAHADAPVLDRRLDIPDLPNPILNFRLLNTKWRYLFMDPEMTKLDVPSMQKIERNAPRKCDGCAACCEGWLEGEAYGYKFWPGRKCHFCTGHGCEIYKNRPKDCKNYTCAWLEGTLPAWMKPSECGAIATWRTMEGGIKFLDVIEAGRRMDPAIISWLFLAFAGGELRNIRFMVDGAQNVVGDTEFIHKLYPPKTEEK